MLVPRLTGPVPELVSDGAGPPFPPEALSGSADPLDPTDPAVAALLAQIRGQRPPLRLPWRRGATRAAEDTPQARAELAGWRELARADGEALFARGRPPALLTVAIGRDERTGLWGPLAITREKPLRAARDLIRASSWRLDVGAEPQPQDTELRILVTEQRRAGGKPATGRFQVPDLHLGPDQAILTIFVNPLPVMGVQGPNPETPVRIALPEPLGERELLDGAIFTA